MSVLYNLANCALICFSVQVVVSGPSKSHHEETVISDVHPTPLHPSNTQVSIAGTKVQREHERHFSTPIHEKIWRTVQFLTEHNKRLSYFAYWFAIILFL